MAASSVKPREAQNSCVGCIEGMKLPMVDAPGRAHALKAGASRIGSRLRARPQGNAQGNVQGNAPQGNAAGNDRIGNGNVAEKRIGRYRSTTDLRRRGHPLAKQLAPGAVASAIGLEKAGKNSHDGGGRNVSLRRCPRAATEGEC